MPTYEYECRRCGHEFEEMQSIKASALRKCPKCAKLSLRRVIRGGAGVIFKGSGFYETDYKQKREGSGAEARAKDAKEESKAAAAVDSKSESKTDSKAESKSDAKQEKPPSAKGETSHSSERPGRKSGSSRKPTSES